MPDQAQAAAEGSVAGYFSRLADTYGDGEYYGKRRAAAIVALTPEIERARHILDLGCGNGAYLQDLVRIGKDAIAVGADLTFDMLSAARRRVGARACYARADATALPFKAAAWDLVFCSHVLQFVTDIDRCVAGIVRCLRPGGVFVTTLEDSALRKALGSILNPEQWEEFRRAVFRAARARRGDRPRDEIYRAAFESAGLATELRSAPFSITGPDIEEFVRVRWMPVASDSGRADMERILAQLKNEERFRTLAVSDHERLLLGRKPA
jgi:ubiquinone/menaquinone biosynthesis C-methylase UbiE